MALAVQVGFRALLLTLADPAVVIRWAVTLRAAIECLESAPIVFIFHDDFSVEAHHPPPCPGVVHITWSGVMLTPTESLPLCLP